MELHDESLLEHIKQAFLVSPAKFPRAGVLRYPDILVGWVANLDACLLPYVTAGGIAISGGHLTLHDKEHIERVKIVTAELLIGMSGKLTPYECVLLFCAIYLHDMGNILGRSGHEGRITEVLNAVGRPGGFDNVEIRTARMIAQVHGGTYNGSKDTITTLQESLTVHGQDVRLRLLAGILRLADELADDPARANVIALATQTLPKGAEVFHTLAAHWHTQKVKANARSIDLIMDFTEPKLFKEPIGKNSGTVYLLDEIFERTLKTYTEARYCSRFMRPYLDFERVNVKITIFDGDGPELETIEYSLVERGYEPGKTIYDLAPELERYKGNGRLTAAHLIKRLTDPEQGGSQ